MQSIDPNNYDVYDINTVDNLFNITKQDKERIKYINKYRTMFTIILPNKKKIYIQADCVHDFCKFDNIISSQLERVNCFAFDFEDNDTDVPISVYIAMFYMSDLNNYSNINHKQYYYLKYLKDKYLIPINLDKKLKLPKYIDIDNGEYMLYTLKLLDESPELFNKNAFIRCKKMLNSLAYSRPHTYYILFDTTYLTGEDPHLFMTRRLMKLNDIDTLKKMEDNYISEIVSNDAACIKKIILKYYGIELPDNIAEGIRKQLKKDSLYNGIKNDDITVEKIKGSFRRYHF